MNRIIYFDNKLQEILKENLMSAFLSPCVTFRIAVFCCSASSNEFLELVFIMALLDWQPVQH